MIISIIPLLSQVTQSDPLVDGGMSFGWLFVKTIVAMVLVIASYPLIVWQDCKKDLDP